MAWDKLLHHSELLSLSVLTCKVELVVVTLLGLGMMIVESVSIVASAIQETPNNTSSSYLSYQYEMECRSFSGYTPGILVACTV